MNTTFRFFTFLVLLCAAVSARAQVTKNPFVGATVSNGYLTIYKGDPAKDERLTFVNMSYLTVTVDGQYYSNNPYGGKIGPTGSRQIIDVFLNSGSTSKIGDTLRTVWKEDGFDIVQNAYPVAFANSGVIVLSIKIVNHTAAALTTQAQFLLDNLNSNMKSSELPVSANDNPYIIHPYGAVDTWQDCQASGGLHPMPSFSLALEFPPDSVKQGTVGVGYYNDSFPPHPLGLMPLSLLEFGDWVDQTNYTWGPPSALDWTPVKDEATLLMGAPKTARTGATDSVTEIMRTAYGTQEFTYCYGRVVAITASPVTRLTYREKTQDYSPNRFYSMTIVYNPNSTTYSGIYVTQEASAPLQTLGRNPIPSYDSGLKILSKGAASVLFQDTVQNLIPGDSTTSIYVSSNPGLIPNNCQESIAIVDQSMARPVIAVQSRTGSFDGSICNARTTYILATDTGTPPLGFAGATTLSATNMAQIIWAPPHAFNILPIAVHVLDSMLDGQIVLRIVGNDSSVTLDTITYCTIPDTLKPFISIRTTDTTSYVITVTDNRPWDRGIDSLLVIRLVDAWVDSVRPSIVRPGPYTEIFGHLVGHPLEGSICFAAYDLAHNYRDTCLIIYSTTAGVTDQTSQFSSLRISPNPSADIFTIYVGQASSLAQTAEVLDVLGRTVARFLVQGTATFDAGALPAGTYVVRVGGMSQRIVKE